MIATLIRASVGFVGVLAASVAAAFIGQLVGHVLSGGDKNVGLTVVYFTMMGTAVAAAAAVAVRTKDGHMTLGALLAAAAVVGLLTWVAVAGRV